MLLVQLPLQHCSLALHSFPPQKLSGQKLAGVSQPLLALPSQSE